ncbi:hypothetical protein D3C87_2072170 [compost metagenome]
MREASTTATFGGLFLLRFLPLLNFGSGSGFPVVLVKIGDLVHHELGKSLVSIPINLDFANLAGDGESSDLRAASRLCDERRRLC